MKGSTKNIEKYLVKSETLPTFVLPNVHYSSDRIHISDFRNKAGLFCGAIHSVNSGRLATITGEARLILLYTQLNFRTMPNVSESTDPKQSKVVTPPTTNGQPDAHYKRLSPRFVVREKFSEQPKAYYVEIDGNFNDTQYYFSNSYDEYHPLMAIGRAVMEFYRVRFLANINAIRIFEKIVV